MLHPGCSASRAKPDVRVLQASSDPHAAEAINLFAYRIAIETGALVSALDGLVFTAGIGRARVQRSCATLEKAETTQLRECRSSQGEKAAVCALSFFIRVDATHA